MKAADSLRKVNCTQYRLETDLRKSSLFVKVHTYEADYKIAFIKQITAASLPSFVPTKYSRLENLARHLQKNINHEFDCEAQTLTIKFNQEKLEIEIEMNLQATSLLSELSAIKEENQQLLLIQNRALKENCSTAEKSLKFQPRRETSQKPFQLFYPDGILQETRQFFDDCSLTVRKGDFLITAVNKKRLQQFLFEVYAVSPTEVNCYRATKSKNSSQRSQQPIFQWSMLETIFTAPDKMKIVFNSKQKQIKLNLFTSAGEFKILLNKSPNVLLEKKVLLWFDLLKMEIKSELEKLSQEKIKEEEIPPTPIFTYSATQFKIEDRIITYIGKDNQEASLSGTKSSQKGNSYSCEIVKTKNSSLCFGVAALEQNENAESTLVQESIIFYDCWNRTLYGKGKGPLKSGNKTEKSVKQKDVVKVALDMIEGKIYWKINEVQVCQICIPQIQRRQIIWVPYLEMSDRGDQIRWIS